MKKPQDSDEWLMGQVGLGKREHLSTLVRRYASPLLTFIIRMVGDRHEAEDMVQETFRSAWKSRRFSRPTSWANASHCVPPTAGS